MTRNNYHYEYILLIHVDNLWISTYMSTLSYYFHYTYVNTVYVDNFTTTIRLPYDYHTTTLQLPYNYPTTTYVNI